MHSQYRNNLIFIAFDCVFQCLSIIVIQNPVFRGKRLDRSLENIATCMRLCNHHDLQFQYNKKVPSCVFKLNQVKPSAGRVFAVNHIKRFLSCIP